MQKIKQNLLIGRNDYEIIKGYLQRGFLAGSNFSRQDADYLKAEVLKAKIVNSKDLPQDVVRINSTVTIEDEKEKKPMQLTLVTPDKANIKQRMISILAPLGTALIGFRKGQKVSWRMPAGKKVFRILEVAN